MEKHHLAITPLDYCYTYTRAELTMFQCSLIVGLSTRTMGIDAKNRLLRKAGTVSTDDSNVSQDMKGKI